MIKTNENKQNSKNPKSTFLGTSMHAHPNYMHAHPNYMRTHTQSMRTHA